MSRRLKRSTHGFSLLEMAVVVAIMAIIMAVAIPSFTRSKETRELRAVANRLVGHCRQAQSLARSGKANVPVWAPDTRTQMAGLRFISATQYAVFVDQDTQANGAASEADVEVVDIASDGSPFIFVTPPPQIRFRKNGTLPNSADLQVDIRNTATDQTKSVRITYGGRASIL